MTGPRRIVGPTPCEWLGWRIGETQRRPTRWEELSEDRLVLRTTAVRLLTLKDGKIMWCDLGLRQ